MFEKSSFDDWQSVIRPKVAGAWNLHNALSEHGQAVDFFITLSSAAGIIGDRGLASYAAANTMLDAFVKFRNRQGLAATSLDLAAVSDIGYLAENSSKMEQRVLFAGEEMSESEVLAVLGAAIYGKMATTCHNHCIAGVAVDAKTRNQFWVGDAKFSHLRLATATTEVEEGQLAQHAAGHLSLSQLLKQSSTMVDAAQIVHAGLASQIATILMIPVEEFDASKPIMAYGLDSLTAIEIRNWIAREMEANVQVLELLASGSLMALARTVLRRSKLLKGRVLQADGDHAEQGKEDATGNL